MKTSLATILVLIGTGGLTVRDAMAQLPASAAASAAASAPATSAALQADLAKGLAWPVVAIVIAFVFYRPLTLFMSDLGSRITKFSIFKVELELVPASAAIPTPLLDDIRTVAQAADINDSTNMMLEQVQSGTRADYVLVKLGAGTEWLTSRLYIAIVMTERMRGVKACVFVERGANTERSFVAVASVSQLRWALAKRYPWLEAAWLQGQVSLYPTSPPVPPDTIWQLNPRQMAVVGSPVTTDTGGFTSDQARFLAGNFLRSLQRDVLPVPTQSPDGPAQSPDDREWVTRKSTQERAAWVTRELLAELLPMSAFDAWAPGMRDAPRARLTRAVLRRAGPFIALVEGDREFSRLTNRQALLEEIAAKLGEEPEEAPR